MDVLSLRLPALAVPSHRHALRQLGALEAVGRQRVGVCRDESTRSFRENTAAECKQLRERKARIQIRVKWDPVACDCNVPREKVGDGMPRVLDASLKGKSNAFVLSRCEKHMLIEEFDSIDSIVRYAARPKVLER